MRCIFILFTLIFLFEYQVSFGQNTIVKGQVVDYITGKPVASKVEYIYNGGKIKSGSVFDGLFEFELKLESDTGYVLIESFGYKVKIHNIPRDVEQVDLGKIKMVQNHLFDNVRFGHVASEVSKDQIKLDKKLRKEVLKKYRLHVNEKKLKPYFEGKDRENQFIVFDFNKE